MKKIVFVLISILVGIFILLSVINLGGEYEAEKLFYRAMKSNAKIRVNPDVTPPALLASVENNLKQLISKYSDAKITKPGGMALAEFYLSLKNYDKALLAADAVLKKYKDDVFAASSAQFFRGIIYETAGKWPEALAEFKILQDKYTLTPMGIQSSLYIASYYASHGDAEKAKEAYRQAALFYEKIKSENTGKSFGYIASVRLVQTFLRSEDYEKAAQYIESTLSDYPSDICYKQLLPYVDAVFIGKLNQPERAVAVYQKVKDTIKDEKLVKAFQKKIEGIEAKKVEGESRENAKNIE